MNQQVLVVGGGMGGLAAALVSRRAGWSARLFEHARQFSEVGAGIQLGPNATRILRGWGLDEAFSRVAAFPSQLHARSALDGHRLGLLRLGASMTETYGAPYATVHRADLQQLLMHAAEQAGAQLHLSSPATGLAAQPDAVRLHIEGQEDVQGDALIAADGVWSRLREQLIGDGRATWTGHLAYRALVAQSALPEGLRSQDVTVWLGPRLHVVAYPVRAGEQLNVVAIVQGQASGPSGDWDQAGVTEALHAAMGPMCAPLQDLIHAMPGWRLWALHDRAPMRSESEMVRGRVALLGDAAHPMRPYLAQGAGMAIEDAGELERVLGETKRGAIDIEAALRRYAMNRWQRGAKVQARARRNGRIFHATGLVRWGRNLSMRLLGERLLDQPWLYR